MLGSIQALEYTKENIGSAIKSFKVLHIWKVQVDNKYNVIELIICKWRKKKTVKANKEIILENSSNIKGFSYTFHLSSHIFTITECPKGIDLHIDGLSFMVLYKRQAGSLFPIQDCEDPHGPINSKWESVLTDARPAQEDWEKRARNYRLRSRTIQEGTLREKVLIIPRSTKPSRFSYDYSPRSTLLSTHFRTPRPESTQSNTLIGFKKRKKRRIINHFLLA
jgi:hypothetical protein